MNAVRSATRAFSYGEAFSRNLGFTNLVEQQMLRGKRVAIAGLGGVGGSHLLTLARLGVGAFNVADFDTFELGNFNRQAGASMSHLGRPKVEVLAEMALDINPELSIRGFPQGVDASTVDEFLKDVDLFIDGLDVFALPARRMVFAACAERKIPAITAGPLGMGTAWVVFLPGGMTFEQYFNLEGASNAEQMIRLLVGIAPWAMHRTYMDSSFIDVPARRVPSTPMGCALAAGVAASEALKILLGRGKVRAAPHAFQFDAYRGRLSHTWRPGGNRNPLNRFILWITRKVMNLR